MNNEAKEDAFIKRMRKFRSCDGGRKRLTREWYEKVGKKLGEGEWW